MTEEQMDAMYAAYNLLGLIWLRAKQTGLLSHGEIDLLRVTHKKFRDFLISQGNVTIREDEPENWPDTIEEVWEAAK